MQKIKRGLFIMLLGSMLIQCSDFNELSWEPTIIKDFKESSIESILPDFSYAGYMYGEKPIPTEYDLKKYDVTDFGPSQTTHWKIQKLWVL